MVYQQPGQAMVQQPGQVMTQQPGQTVSQQPGQSIAPPPTGCLCLSLRAVHILFGLWTWGYFGCGLVFISVWKNYDQCEFYYSPCKPEVAATYRYWGIFGLTQGIPALVWVATLCKPSSTLI